MTTHTTTTTSSSKEKIRTILHIFDVVLHYGVILTLHSEHPDIKGAIVMMTANTVNPIT